MWRDTPDAMTKHTLSYARSKDLIDWETSSGKPLARPLTMAKAEVIDPAKPGEGLINIVQSLGFDGEKCPVAVYHRFDSEGKSQAFVS
jgi:BNR repeat-containing family member